MFEINKGTRNFYIGNAENPKAEITYVDSNEDFIIADGTHVGEELKGQGAGMALLEELINMAKAENKKIMPLCPFVKAKMEENPEYHQYIYK